MSLTVVKGLQSEIFVPVTPPPVWAPVKKELKMMTIALCHSSRCAPQGFRRDSTLPVTLPGEK